MIHAWLAMVQVAPLVEQVRAEAGPPDRLQELLRDDRVRVYIRAIQRRDQALMNVEGVQDRSLHLLLGVRRGLVDGPAGGLDVLAHAGDRVAARSRECSDESNDQNDEQMLH
jgi:hypothetical protein